MILVDTSVWIDFLNSARGPAGDELERLIGANAPLVLAGPVVAEVLQGLKSDVEPIAGLLRRWPLVEPRGFATYESAAMIFREARRSGVTLSAIEALLAALTIEHQAALFTLDRDFGRLAFTGLRLHWVEPVRPKDV